MEHYRSTKAVINLGAIRRNTAKLIQKYPGYQHYMAVVKADSYGYRGNRVVQAMLDGGANCLAASLLEEGLQLRSEFPNTPLLLFTPVQKEYLQLCKDNEICVTVANIQQANDAACIDGLQVAIRANGGSDILGGPTNKKDFHEIWNTLCAGKCHLTAIYLHSYNAENQDDTLSEYAMFEELTEGLPLNNLHMVSVSNSLTLPRYEKKSYCNGCRLGNIVYRIESEDTDLEHTFRLETQIITIFTMNQGQTLAYSHAYTANEDGERVAAVPIGFGDGFSKTNIGRDVYINGKRFPIVAVTMDVSHILVDNTVQENDTVLLIKDNHHLDEIATHIHGASEEAITNLNKRVYREYID